MCCSLFVDNEPGVSATNGEPRRTDGESPQRMEAVQRFQKPRIDEPCRVGGERSSTCSRTRRQTRERCCRRDTGQCANVSRPARIDRRDVSKVEQLSTRRMWQATVVSALRLFREWTSNGPGSRVRYRYRVHGLLRRRLPPRRRAQAALHRELHRRGEAPAGWDHLELLAASRPPPRGRSEALVRCGPIRHRMTCPNRE